MAEWIPFEERPRPPQLSRVKLAITRMERIEIASEDEEAIGLIFAWLLGQMQLAKRDG